MVCRSFPIWVLLLVSYGISGQTPLPILQLVSDRSGADDSLVPYSRDYMQYDRDGKVKIRTSSVWYPETAQYVIASIAEHYAYASGLDSLNRNSYYKHYPDSIGQVVENGYIWNDKRQLTYLRRFFQSSPGNYSETRANYYRNSIGCKSQDVTKWFFNGVEYDETIVDYTTDAHCNILVAYTHSTFDLTNQSAILYDYNDSLLVRQRGYYLYPDSVLSIQADYIYDSGGNLILEQLSNHSRLSFAYEEGREVQRLTEISYNNDTTWLPYSQDMTSYNSAGSVVVATQNRNWDDDHQIWSAVTETTSTYNADNQMTLQGVNTLIFHSGVLFSQTTDETAFTLRCDGVVLEQTTTEKVGVAPGVKTKTTFQYLSPAGCETGNHALLTVFPNPAGSVVQVLMTEDARPSSVKIFSPTGQLAMEFPVGLNPATLDVSTLSPGIYIVEASDGTHRQRSSMVKY